MKEDVILMTERDYLRIKHILSFQNSSEFENLEVELDRAKIIDELKVKEEKQLYQS